MVHTGQLFFPGSDHDAVHKTAPYKSHGLHPDTTNASDAIYRNGGDKGMVKLTRNGAGYTGVVATGVHG